MKNLLYLQEGLLKDDHAIVSGGENADAVLGYLLQREREARINAATVDQVKAEEHAMRKEIHRITVLTKKIALCKTAGVSAPPSIDNDFFQVT
jgi:hypothetical protein